MLICRTADYRFAVNLFQQAVMLMLCATAGAATAADAPGQVFRDLLDNSHRVAAARTDEQGAVERRDETFRRAWTPNLSLTAQAGDQHYQTESIPGTHRDADSTTLRGTQLLYDFGRSSQQVNEADAVIRQTAAVSNATRDGVLLEGLTAHWSAVRARAVLEYSRRSEASVLNLTQIESSLVELGRGYESNVLQAKVQLAAAEARRVRADGAQAIADARVAAVFGALAPKVDYGQVAQPLAERLPASLEQAREARWRTTASCRWARIARRRCRTVRPPCRPAKCCRGWNWWPSAAAATTGTPRWTRAAWTTTS